MEKKNKLLTWIVIISLVAFMVLASLFMSQFIPKSDERVFAENINKVVEIRVSNDQSSWGYGTGCFVASDGTILTNKHMVFNQTLNSNYEYVEVRLPTSNDFVSAQILNISQSADLATIKIEKTDCQYFKISEDIKNGQTIYTIGNPNGFGLSFTKGNVSASLRNVVYNAQTIPAIQTSLVINEGNSGGPVFNQNGELLGLISFRLKDNNANVIQGVSFAVPAIEIKSFLAN